MGTTGISSGIFFPLILNKSILGCKAHFFLHHQLNIWVTLCEFAFACINCFGWGLFYSSSHEFGAGKFVRIVQLQLLFPQFIPFWAVILNADDFFVFIDQPPHFLCIKVKLRFPEIIL